MASAKAKPKARTRSGKRAVVDPSVKARARPATKSANKALKPLPCPFCGRKATLRKTQHASETYMRFVCAHMNCGVNPTAHFETTKAGALTIWNKRAPA